MDFAVAGSASTKASTSKGRIQAHLQHAHLGPALIQILHGLLAVSPPEPMITITRSASGSPT